MGISFDYDFGTREVLVYDAPKESTVIVDDVKYIPERTCKLERVDRIALIYDLSCGHKAHEDIPNYCPNCGAKVVE